MKIEFKGADYSVVAESGDITLQSVTKNITFHGAYTELEKKAKRHAMGADVNDKNYVWDYIEQHIEDYLESIAIMGEVTYHNNN